MTVRRAVYPGSFDPPTLGHLDVIERAATIFDELVVGLGVNSSKNPMLSIEERIDALVQSTKNLPNVTVVSFSGLLVDFAHQQNVQAIVRGLRATADFEYEFQMALMNRRLAKDLETVFLITKFDYSYLSSSMVREVAQLGGDYSGLVPEPVTEIVRAALNRRSTT